MSDRIDENAPISLVSERVDKDTDMVGQIIEATLEEIYEALKRGDGVSLRDFGPFYVRPERSSWIFKFNPTQRLPKLFGWSSTY